MTGWNAEQYLKFADERTRPARDLLAQVDLEAPRQVFDLGCGPGNSTELLVRSYPEADIAGVDSSSDMVAKAGERLPGVRFIEADLAGWTPDHPCDLFFANAVFQWLPDHPRLMLRLIEHLRPGGVLAAQMPDNLDEPVHVLMREIAASRPWARRLGNA